MDSRDEDQSALDDVAGNIRQTLPGSWPTWQSSSPARSTRSSPTGRTWRMLLATS